MTLRFLFPFIACMMPGLFGAPTFGGSEQVPLFVTSVPSGHFAGVSAPMPSLTEARRGALDDVGDRYWVLSGLNTITNMWTQCRAACVGEVLSVR